MNSDMLATNPAKYPELKERTIDPKERQNETRSRRSTYAVPRS